VSVLLRLAVHRMFSATRTELGQFKTTGIVAPILFSRIVVLLAFRASKGDHQTCCFFSHNLIIPIRFRQSPRWESNPWPHPYQGCALPAELRGQTPSHSPQLGSIPILPHFANVSNPKKAALSCSVVPGPAPASALREACAGLSRARRSANRQLLDDPPDSAPLQRWSRIVRVTRIAT
jgi:hypothetical protein